MNFWLGKLQRLQLFGHGVQTLRVVNTTTGRFYVVQDVQVVDGVVQITIKE